MKSRATSVEPVFGNLKSNIGFRRFNLRGLQKVKGEFTLMCIAHNINKLFQFSGGGGCLAPAVVPTPVQNAERDLPLRRALRILEGIYIRKLVFDRRRPSEKCKYLV